MTKVTSKLQVTIPKALAKQYGIEPGDEIAFRPAGSEIRVIPPRVESKRLAVAERLRLFDEASARIRERAKALPGCEPSQDRGWTREELYTRGTSHPDKSRDEPAHGESDGDPAHEDSY